MSTSYKLSYKNLWTSCAFPNVLAIEWKNVYVNQTSKCATRGEEDSKESMLTITWITFQVNSFWSHLET